MLRSVMEILAATFFAFVALQIINNALVMAAGRLVP